MAASYLRESEIIVAGHICLDIIPTIHGTDHRLVPGSLTEVGPATLSTGGAVSNTGLALHRLGVPARLMGKVGDDVFGRAVVGLLTDCAPSLAARMIVSRDEPTSYTIVISPPGADRLFLHCPGPNDTFRAADLQMDDLAGARLFHFGYPPLMRRMWEQQGTELREILESVKKAGLTTSLDMARPDPASPAGKAPWPEILANALPFVDIFLPSLDEILFMLDPPAFKTLVTDAAPERPLLRTDTGLLSDVAGRLLDLGATVVGLKLGDSGFYLRTSAELSRWASFGSACPPERLEAAKPAKKNCWAGRELMVPCFKVGMVGTTGAGDCTIAGFLAAFLKAMEPGACAVRAVAVGAFSVEQADATSGIPPWQRVEERIQRGWRRLEPALKVTEGWEWRAEDGVWVGPYDSTAGSRPAERPAS